MTLPAAATATSAAPVPGASRVRRGGRLAPLGRLGDAWRAEDRARPAWQGWLWTAALLALLGWYAFQVGATHWWARDPAILPDGRTIRLPDTFASIDHPFHIAKERATVDALREGRLPRWFANHQGGFPAEFYPTGGDLIVAAAYFLALGQIPLAVVHKLVVIGVFFLPPLAYWALARRERLPLSVPLLATVIHLFARGSWMAGGSRGLIDYGLWPDTLASYLPLFLILWGADWLRRGDRRGLALAVAVATLAVYTNPRSILGIVAAGLGIGLAALGEQIGRGLRARQAARQEQSGPGGHLARLLRASPVVLAGRGVALALLVGLLTAALLLPLRANQADYHFTIYVRFDSLRAIWLTYKEAILPGVIALAGLGLVVAALRRGFYTRAFAILLPLSALIVALAGWWLRDWTVFAQLEGPRLMPLLRPATIFLAALGGHEALRSAARLIRLRGGTMLTGAALAIVALVLMLHPKVPIDWEHRGLPLHETTDQPAFAAIARAAYLFQAAAGPGDKPLVIGNPISWHASFWVPALTGRDVYHSDYLWFWRTTAYAYQELLQDEPAALSANFLDQHGLTMVLIDTSRDDLLALARDLPYLRVIDAGSPGGYTIYRVASPPGPANGWVEPTAGTVTALDVQAERIGAQIESPQDEAVRLIVNDYPNWRASVNGHPAPLRRTVDGYLQVDVPRGAATVVLTYESSGINWLARGLVALGVALLIGILAWPRLRRWHEDRRPGRGWHGRIPPDAGADAAPRSG